MSDNTEKRVGEICARAGNDKTRMMDILRAVQAELGCISDSAVEVIARSVKTARVEVESALTFYAFLSKKPKGRIIIRLCNDIIDRLNGADDIAKVFEAELGITFGETTADGLISLEYAPCIGMSDQAPAALVNDVVVTYLSTEKVKNLVKTIRETADPGRLVSRLGDGNNAHDLIQSMVHNNIRKKGGVIFATCVPNAGLEKALAMSPVEVINEIKTARLRGRGGAGFPAGIKWEFTRGADGVRKYVICNADEGEPGTFKDRVLLTEYPNDLFEGMTIAGYGIGAEHGILYLRGEYAYLRNFLESILEDRREQGVLGKNVMGKNGFNFDIRIQMGAGAYVCGEETALISSCEGLRGDPKNRPPFPAQKGYLGNPTCVNNVETFVCATRILDKGAGWYAETGSKGSAGTKLLSVSGDCSRPGVYEVPFGITVLELLKEAGAREPIAVQIGGPSGQMICEKEFGRKICYDDLATGGSVMIFGQGRDILEIVHNFMEFFVEESCGYCTPCRVGNVLLKGYLEKVMAGKAEADDLKTMESLAETVKAASRCGLGQTSPNPILTTLRNFRAAYDEKLTHDVDGFQPSFDMKKVLAESRAITGRDSVHFSK